MNLQMLISRFMAGPMVAQAGPARGHPTPSKHPRLLRLDGPSLCPRGAVRVIDGHPGFFLYEKHKPITPNDETGKK